MKGRMYVILPGEDQPRGIALRRPPTLDHLVGFIGDDIEQVPGFLEYGEPGEMKNSACVAFCGTNAKSARIPVNFEATVMWNVAMGIDVSQWDQLRGPVVVLCGDREFMEAL